MNWVSDLTAAGVTNVVLAFIVGDNNGGKYLTADALPSVALCPTLMV